MQSDKEKKSGIIFSIYWNIDIILKRIANKAVWSPLILQKDGSRLGQGTLM